MTEAIQTSDKKPGELFKEETRGGGALIDPAALITEESLSSEFDDLLRGFGSERISASQDSGFGALNESEIQQGPSGLLPPELNGETLAPDEIAFAIDAGELQTIVKTLALLLKLQPVPHRRCRILIKSDGVTWHANEGNGFIEYVTPGRPANFNGIAPQSVIVAFSDLQSSARAARNIATFRIRNGMINFSAHRFQRPILTYSTKTFPLHTEALRLGVDQNVARPDASAATVRSALAFLATIAPSEEADPRLNLIEIKGSVARAVRPSIGAQVESSAFDGLHMTFKPRFLRWILPALKLRGSFRAWHNEKFCVLRNDQLTFGFELVQQELPRLPSFKRTDTLLTPAQALKIFVERAVRMFGGDGVLAFTSDIRGGNSALTCSANGTGRSPGKLEMTLSANRDGDHSGSINIVVNAPLLLQALRISNNANTEISVSKQAILIDNLIDDTKYSVILTAKVQS